jgi:hypothetical protein
MKPLEIEGWTRCLGEPVGWDETRDGKCDALYVRAEERKPGHPKLTSAWMPTPEELAALNAGKPVLLTVLGYAHPPVLLRVEPG